MRIMHAADLHLGCRQYGMARREEDFYDALHQIHDVALEKKVDNIILSGDIFDSPKPPAKAVLKMTQFVNAMRTCGIGVYGIEGNHDKTNGNYWLQVCRIRELDGATPWNLGKDIMAYGLTFDRSENVLTRLEELQNQVGKAHIMALHLGVAEMGAGFNPDLSLDQLVPPLEKLGVKYCALGHIHVPAEQKRGNIWFVQPGSLEMKSIDEPQDKGVEIVEFGKDGEIVSMERVNYPTRKVQFMDIRYDDDLNQFTSAKAEELKDSLVVAYVVNSVNDGVRRITDWSREHELMCRVIPVGDDAKVQKEYDRSNSMNLLKEAVETFFDEGSEQYALVMEILHTGNPRLVMERYMNSDEENDNAEKAE